MQCFCDWITLSNTISIITHFIPGLNFTHNQYYYVTVEAHNYVGLRVRGFSGSIIIDDTHPVGGLVVELSSEYFVNNTDGFSSWENVNCSTTESKYKC